jgi:hypothetical protein
MTILGDVLSWQIPITNAHIRYDITRTERGQWSEAGISAALECRALHFSRCCSTVRVSDRRPLKKRSVGDVVRYNWF